MVNATGLFPGIGATESAGFPGGLAAYYCSGNPGTESKFTGLCFTVKGSAVEGAVCS